MPHVSQTIELLLLLARVHQTPAETERIKQLVREDANWVKLLQLAHHHGLNNLVSNSLHDICSEEIPSFVVETLRTGTRENALAAMAVMRQARQLSEVFSGIGIEITVLKGVPLSQTIYGDPAVRHVGDLDISTTSERLPQQIDLLESMGYKLYYPECQLTPARLSCYVRYRKDLTFLHPHWGFVDLHWRLFDNVLHPANSLLAKKRSIDTGKDNAPASAFDAIDQFLYVAAHGLFDAWFLLKSLADMSAFLRVLTPPQLEEAFDRASQMGMLRHLSAAIHCANEWFGADTIHSRMLSADEPLCRYVRSRMLKKLADHKFMPVRSDVSPTDWLRMERLNSPGLKSALWILGHVIWRPRIWGVLDLPDSLFWLYPLASLIVPPRSHRRVDDTEMLSL